MAKILYLVHRMPYPPNKGDKVRSYHLLRHLAEQHQVYLGTFVDDPEDMGHVDTLRQWCAEVKAVPLHPRWARLASLRGLIGSDALTLHFYRDAGLHRWVDETVAREGIRTAVVFSSSMAQYAEGRPGLRMLVDFVDVDSAKWTEYADRQSWQLSWLYRREGRALLDYERRIAALAARSFFVTEQEADALPHGECGMVEALCNGVGRRLLCTRLAHAASGHAAGLHRRHGLLAQHRRRDLVCARHAARVAAPSSRGEFPHRRAQSDGGRARRGRGTM